MKKSGVPEKEREGSGVLKVEIGVWNSQGGGKDEFFIFFPSTFLSVSHIKLLFSPLKPRTDDYTSNNSV